PPGPVPSRPSGPAARALPPAREAPRGGARSLAATTEASAARSRAEARPPAGPADPCPRRPLAGPGLLPPDSRLKKAEGDFPPTQLSHFWRCAADARPYWRP